VLFTGVHAGHLLAPVSRGALVIEYARHADDVIALTSAGDGGSSSLPAGHLAARPVTGRALVGEHAGHVLGVPSSILGQRAPTVRALVIAGTLMRKGASVRVSSNDGRVTAKLVFAATVLTAAVVLILARFASGKTIASANRACMVLHEYHPRASVFARGWWTGGAGHYGLIISIEASIVDARTAHIAITACANSTPAAVDHCAAITITIADGSTTISTATVSPSSATVGPCSTVIGPCATTATVRPSTCIACTLSDHAGGTDNSAIRAADRLQSVLADHGRISRILIPPRVAVKL